MTKKDYQAIARALHGRKPSPSIGIMAEAQWREDCEAIEETLADDNPRFNRELFAEACETGRRKGMRS